MSARDTLKSLKGNTRRLADFLLAHEGEEFTAQELADAIGVKKPPFAALGTLTRLGIAEGDGMHDGSADNFTASHRFIAALQQEEHGDARLVTDARMQRELTRVHRAHLAKGRKRRRERIGCGTSLVMLIGVLGLLWVGWQLVSLVLEVTTPPAPAPITRPQRAPTPEVAPAAPAARPSPEPPKKRVLP